MANTRSLVVVADDLTGALDASVPFAGRGVVHVLRPGPNFPIEPGNVVATWTDSRGIDAIGARDAARLATRSAWRAESLFIKIDSTMRGNPAAHVAGAMEAWRQRNPDTIAVICPAHPAMGRTVVDGQVLDHGVPITASAASRDPLGSPTSTSIADIFPGCVTVEASQLGTYLAVPGDRDRVDVLVNAATVDDLLIVADAIAASSGQAIAVGSAGLARALASIEGLARVETSVPRVRGRVLFLITSLHPSARRQAALLSDAADSADFLIVTTSEREKGVTHITDGSWRHVAREAATRAATELLSGTFGHVVVIGGDGASALTTALAMEGIALTGEILPDVPSGTAIGGPLHGISVSTRSGGFGDEWHVHRILSALRIPKPHSRETE